MGLDSVGALAIHEILSKLGPADTAAAGCLNKRFRDWAADESLWSKFCSDELDLSSPQDPLGNPTPTFKVTYQVWREAFGMYPWPLVRRVKRCWGRLKSWLSANFPEALATLRKGASEDEIKSLEKSLKVKLPLPTRLLYRFCNGQDLKREKVSGHLLGSPLGLIGGYSFYNHLVNVYLLPLHLVIRETKRIVHQLGFSRKYIIVASSTYGQKIFFFNCDDGQLYVGTRNLANDGEMIPCVPKELIRLVPDFGGSQQQDAMLLWLEEHGHRLHSGVIRLREKGEIRGISLFPEKAPHCSIAITNGVKVRASAVLVPEFSNLQDESEKFYFSYSMRMSLLPEGCCIYGMSFASCQLYRRHLIFRDNDIVVNDVNGEAVIGKFPLLHPGEEEFVYESCTPLSSSGSVEGCFTFVPGRSADPKGDPFDVELARFPLQLPDYIF
ncbi:F-box protein SKIP16 isoform X2 [Rhododendron vialii]|uniref:F-box protein SKIP16 isoform X2 n=1 Tax=Rhododendron vialii TaxID=182163 RepID=UPI00265E240D|nr:F-box protein SKIP16 isoform X2 [Rhododendron vialii]